MITARFTILRIDELVDSTSYTCLIRNVKKKLFQQRKISSTLNTYLLEYWYLIPVKKCKALVCEKAKKKKILSTLVLFTRLKSDDQTTARDTILWSKRTNLMGIFVECISLWTVDTRCHRLKSMERGRILLVLLLTSKNDVCNLHSTKMTILSTYVIIVKIKTKRHHLTYIKSIKLPITYSDLVRIFY